MTTFAAVADRAATRPVWYATLVLKDDAGATKTLYMSDIDVVINGVQYLSTVLKWDRAYWGYVDRAADTGFTRPTFRMAILNYPVNDEPYPTRLGNVVQKYRLEGGTLTVKQSFRDVVSPQTIERTIFSGEVDRITDISPAATEFEAAASPELDDHYARFANDTWVRTDQKDAILPLGSGRVGGGLEDILSAGSSITAAQVRSFCLLNGNASPVMIDTRLRQVQILAHATRADVPAAGDYRSYLQLVDPRQPDSPFFMTNYDESTDLDLDTGILTLPSSGSGLGHASDLECGKFDTPILSEDLLHANTVSAWTNPLNAFDRLRPGDAATITDPDSADVLRTSANNFIRLPPGVAGSDVFGGATPYVASKLQALVQVTGAGMDITLGLAHTMGVVSQTELFSSVTGTQLLEMELDNTTVVGSIRDAAWGSHADDYISLNAANGSTGTLSVRLMGVFYAFDLPYGSVSGNPRSAAAEFTPREPLQFSWGGYTAIDRTSVSGSPSHARFPGQVLASAMIEASEELTKDDFGGSVFHLDADLEDSMGDHVSATSLDWFPSFIYDTEDRPLLELVNGYVNDLFISVWRSPRTSKIETRLKSYTYPQPYPNANDTRGSTAKVLRYRDIVDGTMRLSRPMNNLANVIEVRYNLASGAAADKFVIDGTDTGAGVTGYSSLPSGLSGDLEDEADASQALYGRRRKSFSLRHVTHGAAAWDIAVRRFRVMKDPPLVLSFASAWWHATLDGGDIFVTDASLDEWGPFPAYVGSTGGAESWADRAFFVTRITEHPGAGATVEAEYVDQYTGS